MNGIDPYAYMQQVSVHMHELVSECQIEEVLDELEYLFELIPPDMQNSSSPCCVRNSWLRNRCRDSVSVRESSQLCDQTLKPIPRRFADP